MKPYGVSVDNIDDDEVRVLTKENLYDTLLSLAAPVRQLRLDNSEKEDRESGRRVVIGMVGYPNVGKSSTINVLYGSKKVAVAATPGKTKHFQTLFIGEDIFLCDCPGLVFPSFISTKADMICNGLLPIDQMRDHRPPISLVCQRVSRESLEHVYNIAIPKPAPHLPPDTIPSPDDLLNSYARARGHMSVQGRPDESRAARIILKDFVNGKILSVVPPPILMNGLDAHGLQKLTKDFNLIGTKPAPIEDQDKEKKRKNRLLNQQRGQRQYTDEDEMDRMVRLDSVGHHQGGKRGGKNFVQNKNSNKPWLEMKRAQKAQKRAKKKR
eukprot:CAMPEP_0201520216 /NCGR_PEP_ID=MMETSP0161_2-20130828/10569_1 /ASSEMBLY_ACC=CAM_ASM_000251 /TAXON_ID=180227 /ORGANISM="Neoparamoeba aestuarina, Strain SoJaBio B1-5/56/2" /LENGTH=324 /DNA_ID=CAMNT_0047918509 /DNA_START=60 /DNA_END=1034 /DNA_ORIENTATION=-